MIYVLLKKFRLLVRLGWVKIIIGFITLYFFTVTALLLFEPQPFREPGIIKTLWNITWWFFVTCTTVGYGDITIKTVPGQIVGIADMIFGIGLMFAFIGSVAERYISWRDKRLKGLQTYNTSNHIVILGGGEYKKLRSIILELQNDPVIEDVEIVICSDAYEENPFQGVARFIRGEIGSDDVLRRACVAKANIIIIYGYDDNETIMTAIAVDDINRYANTTVYLRNRSNIRHIERINKIRKEMNMQEGRYIYPLITWITRINDLMLAREVSNPDLSAAILELIATEKGSNTFYSTQAWTEMDICVEVGQVRALLKKAEARALLVGIRRYETGEIVLNPDEHTFVCPKDHLFVIARQRPELDWKNILAQ